METGGEQEYRDLGFDFFVVKSGSLGFCGFTLYWWICNIRGGGVAASGPNGQLLKNSPWNSPSQNTGVGRLALLQRIFPIQESNWGLQDCRRILYQPSNLRLIHYILIKYHKLVFHLIIYISPKALAVLINKMT